MTREMRRLAILLVALAGLGCEDEGRLLTVDLRTDLRAGQEFDRAVTQLFPASSRTPLRTVEEDAPRESGRVAELDGLPAGTYRVRLGLFQGATEVVRGSVIVTLRESAQAVTLVVTADCRDVPCDELTETCRGGACVNARCSPETPELCASPECAVAADCPAPAQDCADAVCLEGVCGERLESSACGSGVCDRVDGCVTLGDGGLDAGPVDAGLADAGFCPEDPCRLVAPQCGCPAGEMCSRAAAPRCIPEGSANEGEPCARDEDCAAGLTCPTNGATCRPYCDDDAICDGARCVEPTSGAAVGLCTHVCDARDGSGCTAGGGCYLSAFTAVETGATIIDTVCLVPGTAGEGEPCPTFTECRPGFACADDVCRQVCDLDAPSCAVGRCNELTPRTTIRGVRYGVCA